MKFSIEVLYNSCRGNVKIRDNRLSVSHTLLVGANTSVSIIAMFLSVRSKCIDQWHSVQETRNTRHAVQDTRSTRDTHIMLSSVCVFRDGCILLWA